MGAAVDGRLTRARQLGADTFQYLWKISRSGDFIHAAKISDTLGGGVQDYLPHSNGRVVGACLSTEYNPDAPYVVLPGVGPDIVRWGDVFAEQREFIPVFLKRGTNAWQYAGRFRVQERTVDQEQIERWETVADRRGEVSMVLYLESDQAELVLRTTSPLST